MQKSSAYWEGYQNTLMRLKIAQDPPRRPGFSYAPADPQISESDPWAGQNAPDALPQTMNNPPPPEPWSESKYKVNRYTPGEKYWLSRPSPKDPERAQDRYNRGERIWNPEYIEDLRRGGDPEAKWGARVDNQGRLWTVGSRGQKRYRDARTWDERSDERARQRDWKKEMQRIRPVTYEEQFAPESGPLSRVGQGGNHPGLLRKKQIPFE